MPIMKAIFPAAVCAVILTGCAGSHGDFIARHPRIAVGVGPAGEGNRNITKTALRFTRAAALSGEAEQGSSANAYRHALWQAGTAARFGMAAAYEAGTAHEKNLTKDSRGLFFDTAGKADEACDLRNNDIGRWIGVRAPKDSEMKALALRVLDVYRERGLWQMSEAGDGYALRLVQLPEDDYAQARARIEALDDNGFARSVPVLP